MPANVIEINGAMKYTLGDSFTEPLVMFLERYCYENMPKGVADYDDRDTIFAKFMVLWAKAHYGKEFDFDICVIKKDVEPGIHTVMWDSNEAVDLMLEKVLVPKGEYGKDN